MKVSVMKNIRIWAVIALLLVSCFMLLSCQSDENVVRSKAEAELSAIKKLDNESLAQIVETLGSDDNLEMFGIDATVLTKAILADFDYKIDKVSVNGDNATVSVTLTHKSLEEAMKTWQTDLTALISAGSAASKTQSELYTAAGQLLIDCINAAPMTTSTVEIPYVKSGGQWATASAAESVFGEAFAGDFI